MGIKKDATHPHDIVIRCHQLNHPGEEVRLDEDTRGALGMRSEGLCAAWVKNGSARGGH